MKRLKKFNEINYNLSNIDSVNENLNISKYQFQLRKLMKKLNIDLYYVERHKLSIFAFFPLMEQLIKIKNPDKKYTIQDILLIIICGINILSYENKDKSQKLINIAIKNDIPESILDYTISIIKKVKGLFTIISEKFGKDIAKFIDMLSYTDLFVPFMNVLNSLVEYDLINFDNIDVNGNDMKFKLLIDKIMKKLQFIISSTDKFQNKENIKPLLVNDELKSPMFRKERVIITESLKDKLKGKSDEELINSFTKLINNDNYYTMQNYLDDFTKEMKIEDIDEYREKELKEFIESFNDICSLANSKPSDLIVISDEENTYEIIINLFNSLGLIDNEKTFKEYDDDNYFHKVYTENNIILSSPSNYEGVKVVSFNPSLIMNILKNK